MPRGWLTELSLLPESNHPADTAGQQFVKSIRPVGMALFLIVAVLVTLICFTSGRDPVPGYKAPETTAYYAEHPAALAAELEKNFFPRLPDYDMSAQAREGGVTVTIDSEHFVKARAAILQYFSVSLFTFEEK